MPDVAYVFLSDATVTDENGCYCCLPLYTVESGDPYMVRTGPYNQDTAEAMARHGEYGDVMVVTDLNCPLPGQSGRLDVWLLVADPETRKIIPQEPPTNY